MHPHSLRPLRLLAGLTALVVAAGACSATPGASGGPEVESLNLDFATYNPLSLIIRDQGWLETALDDRGITVNWVQSAGSNKANENLRAGAVDIGSTAGSAALLARSNGSPIQVVDIYSQPEWAALVVPADSPITSVADLKGRSIAATKGTDPYFFLLQSLAAAGLAPADVTVENLQHADGWAALQNGSVEAWAGLDPIMAGAEEAGAKLVYRNVGFNSYGFLNANESFIAAHPDLVQLVVDAYESARAWAAANPEETARILAEVAALDIAIATKVIEERSNLDVDPAPGAAQRAALATIGPIFVESGDVSTQAQIDDALDTLFNDTFVKAANPERFQ